MSPSTVHSLPGPEDITRAELPNGIVVLVRSNFNSPSVVINGYLPAGGLLDPDEKLGLADFTAASLMRGTARHSFQEIYNILETAGASLGFGGGTHTVSFSGKALAEDLDLLLDLTGECFRQPVFPEQQVERLRAQLLTGLALRAQDTAEMASMAFDRIVYRNHPYSRPDDGYPETVAAITLADLTAFHQRHFGPWGLVIAIAGAVEPSAAVDKVSRFLGDWQNHHQVTTAALPPITPTVKTEFERVVIPGKSQSDLVLGAAGPARLDPLFLPAVLGNSVLGQFGMMGRIGNRVREKAGLAYYAQSAVSGGPGPGPWQVFAGVDPANIKRATELIIEEITQFVSEPVTVEELSDCQDNFIGRLPLSLESNGGVASALIKLERYQLGLDYYRRYSELIRSVTPVMALEAAKCYLDPDRLVITVAGP